jgi:hypothetical protein
VGELLFVAQILVDQFGDFGHFELSAFSGQLSAFGFWLSVVGCRLSVVGCRWGGPPCPPLTKLLCSAGNARPT